MTDEPLGRLDGGTVVSRAGAEHIGAIVELLADDPLGSTRESDPADPVYRRAFDAIDSDPNQLLLVVVDSGAVVATAQVTFIPNLSHSGAWRAQIEGVRVRDDRRGHGLGRAFIEWIVDHARTRGASMLQLTSSTQRTGAVPFYERLGFEVTHYGMKLPLV